MATDLDRTEILLNEGLKTLGLQSRISTEHESDTEAWVSLDDLGITVFVDAEGTTPRTISKRTIKRTGWQVYSIQHLPATRHEPEDVDFVIRGSFDNIQAAIVRVFELAVKDRILGMLEVTEVI